ncbi:alcohol dehydrogenase (NADP+), partial [Reticulomyxa filosa]
VGFGTWKIPENAAENAVLNAIKAGYGLIDCAAIYRNEKTVGKALHHALNVESMVKRDEIFVTSKLWNTDHHPKDVKPAIQRTLRDLQLKHLDLYLMHFPVAWPNRRKDDGDYPEDFNPDFKNYQEKVTVLETWKAMEDLVDQGLTKGIGVSNFSTSLIWELSKVAKKPICVNQIEVHPYLPQNFLVDLCQDKGIQVTGYSSLGSPSYENWAIYSKLPNLLETEEITNIAKKHNKTPAQIVLAWSVNVRNIAVIPKTVHSDRLKENLDILSIQLQDDDIQTISDFDRGILLNFTFLKSIFHIDLAFCVV